MGRLGRALLQPANFLPAPAVEPASTNKHAKSWSPKRKSISVVRIRVRIAIATSVAVTIARTRRHRPTRQRGRRFIIRRLDESERLHATFGRDGDVLIHTEGQHRFWVDHGWIATCQQHSGE